MKILLTGATGFLGSAILKALLKNNHEIIILKRSFSDLRRIASDIGQTAVYDIDQKNSLERIFCENKNIDAVLHTATCYGRKQESTLQIFNSNTFFPLEILDYAAKNGVGSFINTGTLLPLTKQGQMHNYVLSKQQFLEWGRYYSQNINFINMKLDYIYGPGDDKTKFLPLLIENCVKNAQKINLTKGGQKRDFIYISDVVNAYLKIMETENGSYEEFEIGTGRSIALKDAALKIKEIAKSATELNFGAVPYRKDEQMETKTDISKLLKLGWHPEYDFDKGIKEILSLEYSEDIK